MTDTSGPFDSSAWAEAEWYRHMPAAMPSGVIGTRAGSATTGALAFASSGLAITLAVGTANVGGAGYSRTAPATSTAVTANANSTLSRRDRIVLRRSLATHTVTPVVIQGTPAATPVAPAITRDATTFDLPLFSFLVPAASGTNLTGVVDERTWIDQGVADLVRIPHTGDASETSTLHPFQIGDTAGSNVRMDSNEFIALSNGVLANFVMRAANFDLIGSSTVSVQGSATNSIVRKDYVDLLTSRYYDEGAGTNMNLTTTPTAPAGAASLTLPAGTYDFDLWAHFGLDTSTNDRVINLHLYGGSSALYTTNFVAGSTNLSSRDHSGFTRKTLTGTSTTVTLRASADATGGTQFIGDNTLRAVRVS